MTGWGRGWCVQKQPNICEMYSSIDMSLKVITFATHSQGFFAQMLESTKRHGIEHTVLGFGGKWNGFYQKLEEYKNALDFDEDDIVLFHDAFDVVFLARPEEITARYEAIRMREGCDIIVSAEKEMHGVYGFIFRLCFNGGKQYAKRDHDYSMVNSGMMIGRCGSVREMFKRMRFYHDDQVALTELYTRGVMDMYLDSNCEIFLNIHKRNHWSIESPPDTRDFEVKNGRIEMLWGTKPCVIQAPECTDISKILHILGYDSAQAPSRDTKYKFLRYQIKNFVQITAIRKIIAYVVYLIAIVTYLLTIPKTKKVVWKTAVFSAALIYLIWRIHPRSERSRKFFHSTSCKVTNISCLEFRDEESDFKFPPNSIVILGIRAGFGHIRIAHALASWFSKDRVYVHIIDTARGLDRFYCAVSRHASHHGGIIEKGWDFITSLGNQSAQKMMRQYGEEISYIYDDIPEDAKIICTHPIPTWAGIAHRKNFRIVNVLVDNHSMKFQLCDAYPNMCQGFRQYCEISRTHDCTLCGHWVPRSMVETIRRDSKRRLNKLASNSPLDIFIAIGGAGAQVRLIAHIVAFLGKRNTWRVVVNCGDRPSNVVYIATILDKNDVPYRVITDFEHCTWSDVVCLLSLPHPMCIHATDKLIPFADVASFKPGELAFYPVPKITLRHVGSQECRNIERSCEIMDGTVEMKNIVEFQKCAETIERDKTMLALMNNAIIRNQHVYKGGQYLSKYVLGENEFVVEARSDEPDSDALPPPQKKKIKKMKSSQ